MSSEPEFVLPLALRLGMGEISNRRMQLLAAVHDTGSISAAAKAIGMTYKAAWDAVDAINNLTSQPIVLTQHGGAGGGGAQLTRYGVSLIEGFSKLSSLQSQLTAWFAEQNIDHLTQDLRSLFMKTSARNTFAGTITAITKGAVNSEVVLKIQGEDTLSAIITNGSVDSMGLAVGKPAYALIKSSFVIVTKEAVKTSARNQLCGTVERVTDGAVNAEVVIKLAGGNLITAMITEGSTQSLSLKAGDKACALIKASHIIIGVDQ
ncbi:TOBE domain-containing protein [Halothiobacillus sp. DCM-1]|uniref:TOBE domain-containing protein n=1 Tax=Halothiobacillus sp. DCM-1 TaxID=3112558 RepID=UPI003244C9D3